MGMSKLTRENIKHVALLAKLPLKKSEISKFKSQLGKILDYVDKISEMKTQDIPETSQVTGIINRFRKDKVEKERILTQREALSDAKKTYRGYFVVKSVFEE